MKRLQYILFALIISHPCTTFAQDTTFNRVVTVERDYQPNINQASIIPVLPIVLQEEVNQNSVVYSTYSAPLSIGYNLHSLKPSEIRFTRPTPSYGILDGAIGHHNTHLDFLYKLRNISNFTTDVYANHDAYWGSNTLSDTQIGIKGIYYFDKSKFYFGVNGGNLAYTILSQDPLQSLYHADAHIGIQSKTDNHLQYKIQTGYKAFFTPINIEHQVRSHLDLYWEEGVHRGGIKAYVQNNFYADVNPIHNLRIQPFYAFNKKKIRLHVGVNLDMNIGTGKMLSNIENLYFAPSPNVQVQWLAVPKIFNVHAEIEGRLATGTMEDGLYANRYFQLTQVQKRDSMGYTPIASNLGFTIHPLRTMMIDIYGGYSLYKNDYTMLANIDGNSITYNYLLHDYHRVHVGASMHYHFRDIITIKASGNYYYWKNNVSNMPVYDRPNWDAHLRIDANINQKWSLYSENSFEGKRLARTNTNDETLPMLIDLNLGAQYNINRWLHVYLQLGNYLHRQNSIYYGYHTQGCHFLAGVKYIF